MKIKKGKDRQMHESLLLRSARILRRVLVNLSERLSAKADVKNSQEVK